MAIIRKISRTVLLLATLLLLMNSVLPHHHHEQEVCFVKTHCSDEEIDHHTDKSEHKGVGHDHHSSETDFCQIINYYLTPGGKNLNSKSNLKSINKNLLVNTSSYTYKIALVFQDCNPENIFTRDQIGINTKCLTRALRAPPYY